ncbi:MAG TPA: glutamyl-tRNA reductase [Thermoanaerobaculia bacterium]|nr:glutamyl-tRNA reductase [Thermoanaerobaculia bacterium]
MNLVFVGWNHQGTPLDVRERIAFTPERAREAMQRLFSEKILTEGAIVATCNRSEVYGLTDREDDLEALSAFFARFHQVDDAVLRTSALVGRGDETVRHLFRVAAGLDSMVLGEAQILGQIRDAHKLASEAGATRAVTNRLFMSAIECGRKVRNETALGLRPTSVPGIALLLVGRIFEELAGRRVLVVGAGETAELTARLLVENGATDIRVTNRSPEKAAALAASVGGTAVPWEGRVSAAADSDLVLSATGAPEPVVGAKALAWARQKAKRRGPLLILDLAVPRDVEVGVDELSDVYRYDVDALNELATQNTEARRAEVPKAEAVVEEAVGKFRDWYGGLMHVDVLKGLRARFEAIRRQELESYHGKVAALGPEAEKVVDRLTDSIVAKILHHPTLGLKEGDASERLEKAAAVKSLFKLDPPEKP